MVFDYTTYRNREGTFYRPSINITFKYGSAFFPYTSALVDTGSDFVMVPLSIAEELGAEPDFESVTELNCACGSSFKSFNSRYPIEIVVDHKGFRPKSWETHVKFVEAEVTVLLGHRGFLDRFDALFSASDHTMSLTTKQ